MASVITCIVLEGIMIQEISQRKISILYDLTYMWNLKKIPQNTHTKISELQTGSCQRQGKEGS